MSTQLTIIEQNKQYLQEALSTSETMLQLLDNNKKKEFRNNFLELASNDYLLASVNPAILVKFAVSITILGLNINPVYKEVYLVPYNTQIRKNEPKMMLPQAIIPLNGIQEMANNKGFFLRLYEVYNFDGEIVSEKEMERRHQILLNTTDEKWFNNHFVGFDVILTDLTNRIPEQIKFVEKSYLEHVTDKIKNKSFKAQTFRHKAARRAFGDFNIPRDRNLDVLIKLDHLNDSILEDNKPETNLKSLEQLGITTIEKNGLTIIQGNTYGKTDYLKAMGFVFHGGQWVKEWKKPQSNITTIDAEELPATQDHQNVMTLNDAKKELFKLFNKFGLPKNRQKEFVMDYLGIKTNDLMGMLEIISKKEELKNSIDGFLAEPVLEHVS